MRVLGIESSCDETAAAVVGDGDRVLSSTVATQHDLHAEFGGVVPEIASRAHVERILPVVRTAVRDAGIDVRALDAIAVAHRPGLIGSLLVGVAAAKALAWSLGKPLIGVDHVHAHLDATRLRSDREDGAAPVDADLYPALGLVVSGGHTATYRLDERTRVCRLGSTIDDALGEAYDKVAQILGLGHPGGPEVDLLASDPATEPERYPLPLSRLPKRPLDFSFSGLKTAVLYAARGNPRPAREGGGFPRELSDVTEEERRDLAAAFQRTAVRSVIYKLGRALDEHGAGCRSLLAGGGVVSNSHLRDQLGAFATSRGLRLRLPDPRYCIDNGAMIASLGAALLRRGEAHDLTLTPHPSTAC
jgi:N6-L-threonylcarbamoyladenine synthase